MEQQLAACEGRRLAPASEMLPEIIGDRNAVRLSSAQWIGIARNKPAAARSVKMPETEHPHSGKTPVQGVPKPYTVPEGYVPPTLGEQWRYVSLFYLMQGHRTGSGTAGRQHAFFIAGLAETPVRAIRPAGGRRPGSGGLGADLNKSWRGAAAEEASRWTDARVGQVSRRSIMQL